MDYVEIILDSGTAFQSSVSGSSPRDTPNFDLGQGITNVIGAKVIEAVVPFSWYTWTANLDAGSGQPMNQIQMLSGNQPSNYSNFIPIPVGNYSGLQMATYLTTYCNSAAFLTQLESLGYGLAEGEPNQSPLYAPSVITYNPQTLTFSWSLSLASQHIPDLGFQLFVWGYADTGGANGRAQQAAQLGFKEGNNLTYTDEGISTYGSYAYSLYTATTLVADCTGPNYLYVCSKVLGPLMKCVPNQDASNGQNNLGYQQSGYSTPEMEMIPVNANPGGIVIWQDQYGTAFNLNNLFQLQKFDMYLSLGPYVNYAPIKLNGLTFQIKLKLVLGTDTAPLTSVAQSANQNIPPVASAIGQTFNTR